MTKGANFLDLFKGTLPQLLASLAGNLNALSDGMQYGWSAPVVPLLLSGKAPVQITESDEGWLETIYLLGSLASLPSTIYLVDKIGRKNSILGASVTGLIAWILIGVATSVEYLYVARFIAGLAGDVAFVAAPMYVAEIADQKIRGFLSGIIYLMMLVGILIIYAVVPFSPFYVPSVLGGSLLVLQLATFSFMPESPYYLLSKNKTEKARTSLAWLRNRNDNDEELAEISQAIKREQEQARGKLQDFILVKSNRKALIIILALNGAQHFCGISVLMMNVHKILQAAGSTYLDENISAILFGICMLVSATISSFTVDKYGRKILLTVSSGLTGICVLALAIYFHLKQSGQNLDDLSWIPVAAIMLYAVVFKFGLGMVPIVMTAEVFSSKMKAMGMTIADGIYIGAGFLSIEMYQDLESVAGIHVSFYIFAFLSFAMVIFSALYLPETKGKSLEEVQMMLKGEYVKDVKKEIVNNNNV